MKSITSTNVKIPQVEDFDTEYIENYLKNRGYDLIRWAITDVGENEITVSVSY